MKQCRYCRFAQAIGKGRRADDQPEIDVGICRARPPVAGPVAQPLVALDADWCGEFKGNNSWWSR